jgi:hypothetical protein
MERQYNFWINFKKDFGQGKGYSKQAGSSRKSYRFPREDG